MTNELIKKISSRTARYLQAIGTIALRGELLISMKTGLN
jgi:hypothetical protein